MSGRNDGTVHRTIGSEDLDNLQSIGINQFGVTVSGGSDDHTLVSVEVQATHSVSVDLLSQNFFASLGIVLHNVTGVETRNNVLISNGPAQAGGLVIVIDGNDELGSVQRSRIILLVGN